MKNQKVNAGAYFTASLGVFGYSFLPGVSSHIFLRATGVAFFLVAILLFLSSKFNWRWLVKTTETFPSFTHMSIFLSLYSFALILIHNNYVLQGLTVAFIAYMFFGYKNGTELGKSLRIIFNKLNIFQTLPELPKDL